MSFICFTTTPAGGHTGKKSGLNAPFVLGSNLIAWMRILADNRFAIAPHRLPWALAITLTALIGAPLNLLHDLIFSRRIRNTVIRQPPLFVIGHWRSGTTWLHELLSLDDSHTYPNTYECLLPYRFALTERFDLRYLAPLFNALLPSRRPFDNVAMGWMLPQEDEFALCKLGVASPYQKIAFPNKTPPRSYFDLQTLPPRDLDRWKHAFLKFLRQLTLRDPRRIVLKSPTHTYRVELLLKLFPDAQFVHIVRDPYVVFQSTLRLWQSLYQDHGLQTPDFRDLEESVFENFTHLHERLDAVRPLLSSTQFHELRYEDLVRDPVGEISRLYSHLNLNGITSLIPKLNDYLEKSADYRTNRYEITPALREKIRNRWGAIIDRYGY